jgi:hypothetical protein
MLIRKKIMKRNPLLAVSVCSLLLVACTAADIDNFFIGLGGALSANGGSTASQCAKSDLNIKLGRPSWRYVGRFVGGQAGVDKSYDANSIRIVDNNPNIIAVRMKDQYVVPITDSSGTKIDREEYVDVFYCKERSYEVVRLRSFYRNRLVSTRNAGAKINDSDLRSPYWGYSNNPSCGARMRYGAITEKMLHILCDS